MADSKISALPASTVPLAGTEVLPIVQGGATAQVSVANLTAGRAVAANTLAVANGATLSAVSPNANPLIIQGAASTANTLLIRGGSGNAQSGILFTEGGTPAQVSFQISTNQLVNGAFDITPSTTVGGTTFSNPAIRITSTSDVNIKTGNLVQGTAAKGINFTANTPKAGMTSQLLNWYEEGAWTPGISFGNAATGITYTIQTGFYTRVGNLVTLSCYILMLNKGSATGSARITGLPFTCSPAGGAYAAPGLFFSALTFSGQVCGYVEINATTISLNQTTELGVASTLTDVNFANSTSFIINVTYRAQ